ncbi:MAG: efflux RND transporter periplasmic adaptor subunit [Gammaproteobacteria bacterium]|jgi:cobalt-zinc-cadmium efflux system membrane fusion protein
MIDVRRMTAANSRLSAVLTLAGAMCTGSLAGANTLALDGEQIRRLGVEFAAPQSATTLTVANAPAEIVIPPVRQSVASTPVDGLVASLHVAVGDVVERGQPIAEILSAEYMDMQRRYLDTAVAEELAAAQMERDEGLYADGIIADRRMQETRAAAQSAGLALSQARQQLRMAGLDDAAIGRLETGRALNSVLTLVAPLAGAVIEQYAGVGSSLDTLAPVLKLADLSELWLEVRLPQEVAARVDDSMQIRAVTNHQMLTGTIIAIGQVVDASTQTVLVRAAVDNSAGHLRAGQFLTAEVVARSRGQGALAVPNGAVTREGGESFVFVRRESGVEPVRVNLLAEGSDQVFIESGFGADARIAISGVSALKALWLSEDE